MLWRGHPGPRKLAFQPLQEQDIRRCGGIRHLPRQARGPLHWRLLVVCPVGGWGATGPASLRGLDPSRDSPENGASSQNTRRRNQLDCIYGLAISPYKSETWFSRSHVFPLSLRPSPQPPGPSFEDSHRVSSRLCLANISMHFTGLDAFHWLPVFFKFLGAPRITAASCV